MGRLRDTLGIRLVDAGAFLAVLAAVEITVATGGGPGSHPLNTAGYVAGGILVLPVLLRHKWPLQVLIACSSRGATSPRRRCSFCRYTTQRSPGTWSSRS